MKNFEFRKHEQEQLKIGLHDNCKGTLMKFIKVSFRRVKYESPDTLIYMIDATISLLVNIIE